MNGPALSHLAILNISHRNGKCKEVIPTRIRELREKRGLTVAELSRSTGVTPAAVVQWENGAVVPATGKLPTIAAVLECEVGDLYDSEELRAASEAAVQRMREAAQRAAKKLAEQAG